MKRRFSVVDLALAGLLAGGSPAVALAGAPAPVSVLTHHNDVNRTGWNPNESILTTGNVSAAKFGLLHTVAVDGRVDAQPLVLPNVTIGKSVHDVVYVATENDTVYAVDGKTGKILLSRNLGVSIPYTSKDGDDNIYPVTGIASTPVIDPGSGAIYLVTDDNEGPSAPDVFRLHMLSISTLADMVPSEVILPATVLSNGSTYTLPAKHERQRAALLEANGTIYVGFSSTGDAQPTLSRGVVAGFSAATLAPTTNNEFPNRLFENDNPFYLTSIWQSGYGPAADSSGNIYFSTGNSSPSTPSYNATYNFPDSVLKVSADLSTVLDSFTQYTYFSQDQADGDFGSGGTLLVPDQSGAYPHLLVAGGKDGKAYVLNRDALGGYTRNGPNNDLAELPNGSCWCGPAYFVGADGRPRLVTGGGDGVTTWIISEGAQLTFSQEGQVSRAFSDGQPDDGGTIPAISSNGTAAKSAILWLVQRPNDTQNYTMYLRAFDAANLSRQLFSAPAGNWTNFNSNANAVPTVANGRVYVGSYKQLTIFGLLGKP